jgi:WD40 repeat protein
MGINVKRLISILLFCIFCTAVTSAQAALADTITAIAWNQNGDMLLIGRGHWPDNLECGDGSVVIWQQEIQPITLSSVETCGIVGVGFSPDDERLVAQNAVGIINIWDSNFQKESALGIQAGISKMELAPSDALLARVLFKSIIHIIDYEASDPSSTLVFIRPESGKITDLSWQPDGQEIAVSSLEGTVTIWGGEEGDLIETISYESSTGKTAIAWSPTEDKLAIGDLAGRVIIWDISAEGLIYDFDEHTHQIHDLIWSPDGTGLASASEDGTVKVWDAETGNLLETLTYPGPVYALDWSPDGTKIAYGGEDLSGNPPQVEIVDAPTVGYVPSIDTP